MNTAPPGHPERGVTLAFVALSMAVIIGIAALVIDLGAGRLARRSLVTATDAAALAAAQEYALGGDPCPVGSAQPGAIINPASVAASVAGDYLLKNYPDATLVAPCAKTNVIYDRLAPAGTVEVGGQITIRAQDRIDTSFAPAIGGADSIGTSAASSAHWGPPSAISQLRPLGLCALAELTVLNQPPGAGLVTGSSTLIDLVRSDLRIPGPGESDYIIRIPKLNVGPTCGHSENLMLIDFDGGTWSRADLYGWASNGWDELTPFDNANAASSATICSPSPSCFKGRVGSFNARTDTFNRIASGGDEVFLPIFDRFYPTTIGSNSGTMHLIGVLPAQVVGAFGPNLEIIVSGEPQIVAGPCCNAGVTGRLRVVSLCGVDPEISGVC